MFTNRLLNQDPITIGLSFFALALMMFLSQPPGAYAAASDFVGNSDEDSCELPPLPKHIATTKIAEQSQQAAQAATTPLQNQPKTEIAEYLRADWYWWPVGISLTVLAIVVIRRKPLP